MTENNSWPVLDTPPAAGTVPDTTTDSMTPEKWVEATGAGKICGNCHSLLTPAGSDRRQGVIGVITGKDSYRRTVSGADIPVAGYASKICPSCGVGNRHALIPAPKPDSVQSVLPVWSVNGVPASQVSGYSSLGLTPLGQQPSGRPTPAQMSQFSNDAPSGGYATLGFFIPLVGLILFLVWHNEYPLRAKSAGTGALIGFIVGIFFSFIRAAMS